MTQQQLGEELKRLREENPEDKAASGKLIKEFLDQRREFFGEAANARNTFMIGYPLTYKETFLLCEYIRKLEKMTGLEFLQ